MRRIVLTLAALAAVPLASPSFADTTMVGTPDSAPVGVTVTVNGPVYVTVPADPLGGSGSVEVHTGSVTLGSRGVPTLTPPADAPNQDRKAQDKKDKDKSAKDGR